MGGDDGRLLTVPEELAEGEEFWLTGNEYVALPEIRARDGAVMSLNVLSWGARGMLELAGEEGLPLLRVGLEAGPDVWPPGPPTLHRVADWVPELHYPLPWGVMRVTWLTPPGRKGLVVHVETDETPGPVTLYLEGGPARVRHRIFTARVLDVPLAERWHRWLGSLIWEAGSPWPFLALAVRAAQEDASVRPGEGGDAGHPSFRVARRGRELTVMLGLAPEGDGAACQVIDLLRHGYGVLLGRTRAEIARLGGTGVRRQPTPGPGEGEAWSRWRLNLLFNFFYSRGRCLDSEELVLVTSRSPRYYVCAAHWARDALLWSFPGLLVADTGAAREALLAAYRLYSRRAGTHSLYLDGTELYPGFELDELAAFPVALGRYLEETGDRSVLESGPVQEGLARVWEELEAARLPAHHLYRTFLLPSDDPAHHPVVTYDNVLVWRALGVYAALGWPGAEEKATRLRTDLHRWGVVPGPWGPMWAWSFTPPPGEDEAGGGEEYPHLLYDEPPGSLALLPYYGWCDALDPVYLNTLRWIWSAHNPWYAAGGPWEAPACPHARHPWVMSLANALLVPAESWRALGIDRGRFAHLLCSAPLDGGLACETVDGESGRVRTGAGFASCAGLMAWALARAGLPG